MWLGAVIAMRVQVKRAECVLAELAVFKEVIGPKAALHLVRDFLNKDLAQFFKLRVHTGIAANHGNNSVIIF